MVARTSFPVTPPMALDARGLAALAWRENTSQKLAETGVTEVYDKLVKADFQADARPMKPEEVAQFTQRAQDERSSLKTFDQMKAMDLDDRPDFVAVHYGEGTIIGELGAGRSEDFHTNYVNPAVPEYRIESATIGAQIQGVWVQGQGSPESVKGTRYYIDRQSGTGLILEFASQAPKV